MCSNRAQDYTCSLEWPDQPQSSHSYPEPGKVGPVLMAPRLNVCYRAWEQNSLWGFTHLFYTVLWLFQFSIWEQYLLQHSPQLVHMVPELDNMKCCRGLYLKVSLQLRCPCVMRIQGLKHFNVLLLSIFFLLKQNKRKHLSFFFFFPPTVVRALHRKSEY